MDWKEEVDYKTCPRCGEETLHPIRVRNALSRRDNKTYICSDCGTNEAMIDLAERVPQSTFLKDDFTDKVVGIAKVEHALTEKDIESIMVGGMEGGIGYWAGLDNADWNKPRHEPNSIWATKLLLKGEEVKFYDVEDEEERWSLTLEKLIKGYELNATLRSWDSNLEEGDASTCDCIIQYALFGKIVYG